MNLSISFLYNQSYFSIETINFEEKCLLDKHFFLIVNNNLKKEEVLNILHRLYKERDLLINDILNSKISKEDYMLICRNGIKENEKSLSKIRLNKVVDEKGVEEEDDNMTYDNRSNNSNNSNRCNKRKEISLYHFRSCNRNSIDNKDNKDSIDYEEKTVNRNRKFKSFHDINNEYKNIGKSININDSKYQKQKKESKNKSSFNFFSLENNIQNHIQNRISIFKDEIKNINNNYYFKSKDFLYTEETERRFFPIENIKKLDYIENIIYFDIDEVEKAVKEQPKAEYFQYKLRFLKDVLLKKEKMNENPYALQRVCIKEAEGMISLYKVLHSYIDLEINPIYDNLKNTIKGRIQYIINNLTLYISNDDIKVENNNQLTSSTIIQITKGTKDKRKSILYKERDSYIKDKMLSYLRNKHFQFKSAMSYSEKNEYTFNKTSIEIIKSNISILNKLIEEYEETGNIKNINDVPQNFTPKLINFEEMTKREVFFDELIKNYEKMRLCEIELHCLLNETDQFEEGNEEVTNNDNNEHIYDNKEMSFSSDDLIKNKKSNEKDLGKIEKVRNFDITISDEKAIFKQKLKVYSNIINILKKSKENLYTPLPKYETEYLNIIEEIENNSLSEKQIQITFSQPIPGFDCKYYIQSFSTNSKPRLKSTPTINNLFIPMTNNKNPSSIYTYECIYDMDVKQYKSFLDTNQIKVEVYVPYKISLIKCGFILKYYFHINTSDFSIKSTIIKENILFDIKTNQPSQYYTVTTLQIKRALYRKEIQIVSKPFYNIVKFYPTFVSNHQDDDKPKLTEKEIFTLEIEKNFFFSKEQGLHNVNLKEKLIEMRRKYEKEEEDEVLNGNIINLNNSRLRLNDVRLEENFDLSNKKNMKKIKFKNSNNNLNILNSNENINQSNKKTSIFKFYTINIPKDDDSVLKSNTKIKSNKNIKTISKSFSSPQNQQKKVKIYNINSLSSKEVSSPLDIDYYCSIRTLEMRLSNLQREYKKQDYIVDSEKNHINQLKNKLDNINKKLNIGELTLKDYIQILRIRLERDNLLLINYYYKPNSEFIIKEISERINTLKMEIEECGA